LSSARNIAAGILNRGEVDSVEQPMRLLDAELDRFVPVRPDGAVGFGSFGHQPEAVAALAEGYLEAIAAPVAEYEQRRDRAKGNACSIRMDNPLKPARKSTGWRYRNTSNPSSNRNTAAFRTSRRSSSGPSRLPRQPQDERRSAIQRST